MIRRLPGSPLANGSESFLQLHEIRGEKGDGPTLGLCAGIHGNEQTGPQILLELSRRLDPATFRGRVLLLPVANPLAFAANRRHTPLDDLNLNRVFPGNGAGWFSEQLAAVITEEFLTRIDALVDIHSGGDRPTVDYIYIRNSEALSRSFGSRVLYRADPEKTGTLFSGTSLGVTEERGVPSLTVELGGGLVDQRPYIERGVRGITNIMHSLEMLEGPARRPPHQIVVNGIQTFRPRAGGFLESEATSFGEALEKGSVLGRIVSPYSFEELEVMENPVEGGILILCHLTRNLVEPGDYAFMIGELE